MIIIKYVTETQISLEISDVQVSISYFDQILGKRESETRQVFNFAGIETFRGYKITEKWSKIAKFSTFNVFV